MISTSSPYLHCSTGSRQMIKRLFSSMPPLFASWFRLPPKKPLCEGPSMNPDPSSAWTISISTILLQRFSNVSPLVQARKRSWRSAPAWTTHPRAIGSCSRKSFVPMMSLSSPLGLEDLCVVTPRQNRRKRKKIAEQKPVRVRRRLLRMRTKCCVQSPKSPAAAHIFRRPPTITLPPTGKSPQPCETNTFSASPPTTMAGFIGSQSMSSIRMRKLKNRRSQKPRNFELSTAKVMSPLRTEPPFSAPTQIGRTVYRLKCTRRGTSARQLCRAVADILPSSSPKAVILSEAKDLSCFCGSPFSLQLGAAGVTPSVGANARELALKDSLHLSVFRPYLKAALVIAPPSC